jgi:hypothetical protein
MASTYSDLKFELITTGEQAGTWGITTDTNIGTAIQEAITGSADVAYSTAADVTVTLTDTNATQTARNLRLNLTESGAGVGYTGNLVLGSGCQIEKLYIINNGTTGTKTVKNTTGTGIAVPAGKTMLVFNNGTNVVDATTYLSSLTLGSALPVASGGTGATSNAGTAYALKGANSDITSLTGLTTALSIAQGGTGATTLAGANLPVTNVANTFTGLQTFAGTSSNADLKTSNILEVATVSATAATGTINYDTTTQSVLYYTTNASANWTVNFRGSSGTSLNTIMATGESMSVTFLVTQGSTAYYNSAVQVDGSSVTPKWQGGTAPTSGNASSIDSYTYVIIKTGSATFTVLATQTKFA